MGHRNLVRVHLFENVDGSIVKQEKINEHTNFEKINTNSD